VHIDRGRIGGAPTDRRKKRISPPAAPYVTELANTNISVYTLGHESMAMLPRYGTEATHETRTAAPSTGSFANARIGRVRQTTKPTNKQLWENPGFTIWGQPILAIGEFWFGDGATATRRALTWPPGQPPWALPAEVQASRVRVLQPMLAWLGSR
jgi:hypothetical protein